MAEGNSTTRRDRKRFTDVSKEPDKPLPPLQKFTFEPLLPLQDAVKSLQKLVDDLMTYVTKSLSKCKYPKDGLTQNESAALYLYSLQWPEGKHSFYAMFNRALRSEDRTKLVPYHSYLHLFMTALEKLPSIQDRVWRGVNVDISGQYNPKSVHVWWGASSCSDMVQETDTFLDKDTHRTLFNIKCYEGKMIKNHSAFPNESEIVLPPGTCLRVKSVSNPAPKLHIVDMEQIPYEEPSSETISSTASAAAVAHHVCLIWLDGSVNKSKDNIETQEQLRQLHTKFETFEKADQCENFIQHSVTSSRIILIVGGQIGRQIVTEIHEYSQLKAVFVFCMNKVENEKWAKNHNKIKAVIVHSKELIQKVKEEVAVQVQQKQLDQEAAAQIKQKHGAGNVSSENTHFSDLPEPKPLLVPLEGYQREPLVSLEEATRPIAELIPDVARMVWTAKGHSGKPSGGLTQDESASILIYGLEWEPRETSFYYVLNAALRSENRQKVKPWFRYLKLLLTALYKLPSFQGTVWRGVNGNLGDKYQKGQTYTWWTFPSVTLDAAVLESTAFLGKHGARTMFSIQCRNAKSIREHSMYPKEEEVLLMPGFHFEVLSNVDLGNGLCMINTREAELPFPLLPPPF